MSTHVLVPQEVKATNGIDLHEAFSYNAEAFDVVEVTLAPGADDVEVDLQPGALEDVRLFGIMANAYQEGGVSMISMKIHDAGNPTILLDSAVLLVGTGAVSILGADPDKIFLSNAGALARNITIVIARDATP